MPDAANRDGAGHFVRAELGGIPFAPGSFGLVISFQVIEHLEDPTVYLRTIARLLVGVGSDRLDGQGEPLRRDGVVLSDVHLGL